MSDKHTDALEKLDKFQFAEGGKVLVHLDEVKALFRATEGQAQTSAAKRCAHANTKASWDWVACEDCGAIYTGSGEREWGIAQNKWFKDVSVARFYQKNGFLPQGIESAERPEPAAQLADSTAPGAPTYDELAADLKTARATIRVMTEGRLARDAHIAKLEPAAPTAQQSLTAGGAVPDELDDANKLATLVAWFKDGKLPENLYWKVGVTAEAMRRVFAIAKPSLPRVQSEPQGWDVDDLITDMRVTKEVKCERENMRREVLYAQADAVLGFAQALADVGFDQAAIASMAKGTADRIRKMIAAAPLPQVQSEAIPREPTEAMQNGARDWSVKKYGIGIGKDAAIGCWQAMYDAAISDQQPVTPSGALADNDGGVK